MLKSVLISVKDMKENKKLNKLFIVTPIIILVLISLSACERNLSQNNPTSASQTPAGQIAEKSDTGATTENSGFKTFTHPGYGFSFDYPDSWNASSFSEGDGETVLIQKSQIPNPPEAEQARNGASKSQTNPNSQNSNDQNGLQIYISEFDEPETGLTRERILQDIPDLKIANEQAVKLSGLDGLRFDSVNQSGQATKEIWLVHNGFLYQISAVVGSEEVLNKMIESWKFN